MTKIKLNESLFSLFDEYDGSGKYYIRIIKSGVGSSAEYTPEILESATPLFKAGTLMFLNHATDESFSAQPERTVQELAGVLTSDAVFADDAIYAECKVYSWVNDMLRECYKDIGVSIVAFGTVDGSGKLTSLDEVHSVDLVTMPGAGGALLALLESRRPTLANTLEENKMDAEMQKFLEGLAESVSAIGKRIDSLEAPKVESPVDPVELAEAFVKSELPTVCVKHVMSNVESGMSLDEAITAEKEYVSTLKETVAPKQVVEESAPEQYQPVVGFVRG